MSCNTSAGLLIFYYIKIGMNIIFIVTPIILLIMSTIDLFGAVVGDNKSLGKAWSNIVKRMIIAVVILILPALISMVLSVTTINSNEACLNKATKANIERLEKEEKAKKELEEKTLKEKMEAQLAKLKTQFNELNAKEQEERAKKQAASTTLIPRNYTTSHSATGMINVAKSQIGVTGGQPYWSWWGYKSRVAWCAIFVSWVANQNGLLDGTIPKFQNCNAGVNWFKSKGQWQGKSYSPKPGDIVFFDWNGDGRSDHVGIVEYVKGNKVYTIEGNASDSVARRGRTVNDIIGYGIPNYK